jgi:hypothetical protein
MALAWDILNPSIVTGVVSQVKAQGDTLQKIFGFQEGGPATRQVSATASYDYDIFNNTQTVMRGRLPGTPAGTIPRQQVGRVTQTFGRGYEKIPLDYEQISNIRVIGENAGTLDKMGFQYMIRQARYLKQRQQNYREFITGALFRGGVYGFNLVGEDLLPVYDTTNAYITNDLKMSANFKSTAIPGLPMDTGSNLVTAAWSTTSTDIPAQLANIDAGFQQAVNAPLKHIFLTNVQFLNVLQNDKVRQLAGTANKAFSTYEMMDVTGPDGNPTGAKGAVLTGLPYYMWHTFDGYLDIYDLNSASTKVKILDDLFATFTIEIDPSWLAMVEGMEIVKENMIADAHPVMGGYSWLKELDDTARVELYSVLKVLVELTIPKGVARAKVA